MSISTQNDVRNLLWVVRHYHSQADAEKRSKVEIVGLKIFGAKAGVRGLIADFVAQNASSYKLQSFDSDQKKQKYLKMTRAIFATIDPNFNQLATLAILRCVQRDNFALNELDRARKNNTLMERSISRCAVLFGTVSKVSGVITAFIYGYSALFATMRFLERSITGQDRWEEIDKIPEEQHLISPSTASFIFLKLPLITTAVSWTCSRQLTKFSAFAIQTRLTNQLFRLIHESTREDRRDFSREAIQRDQRLLMFLLGANE